MQIEVGRLLVRLAESDDEVRAAQRLRYRVFVEEMGARVSDAEQAERRERDRFDPYFEHLLLIDREAAGPETEAGVVGAYRLLTGARARAGIGFYGESEYDLARLHDVPSEVVELGRSCVDAAYRGGASMHLLWSGLAKFVQDRGIEVMFGVASFHGTDPKQIADALSFLHHEHLAPEDLRVPARAPGRVAMDLIAPGRIDRQAALKQIPALIKAYLRLGGVVGEGAFIDHEFNTIDVCLLMDTGRMTERYRAYYAQKGAAVDRVPG